jgi:protein phosphatase 1 regulatory subunit 7
MKILRITDPEYIDEIEISNQINESLEFVIQFSNNNYSNDILNKIDRLCNIYSSNFSVRFYGQGFDPIKLKFITNVKSLYIDCISNIGDLSCLKELEKIEKFYFGVYNFNQFDFLSFKNLYSLKELRLGETKIKFDLNHIKNFDSLYKLDLVNQSKNIEKISDVESITELGLSSMKNVDLTFLNNFQKLKKLHILLGGIKSLSDIKIPTLNYLTLIRIRGLENIGDISRFKNLQYLQIEDQIKLESVEIKNEQNQLVRLLIHNCKGLKHINGIENLKSLTDLRVSRLALEFDEFCKYNFPENLKTIYFGTGRKKDDEVIKDRLSSMGYKLFSYDV